MSSTTTSRRNEIEWIFCRALPLIDSALVDQYSFSRKAADELELCLHEWFHSFARRPGSPETLGRLRSHLLTMACNAGHVYWSAKSEEDVPADRVKRSLALGPERIAIELEGSARDGEKPGGDPEEGGSL